MDGFFYKKDLALIKEKNDIASVIKEDVCPLCRGENFAVSVKEQLFNCADCGESGDVFYYVMKKKGLSFNDSVLYLANRAGLPQPQLHIPPNREEQYKMLCAINNEAGKFFNTRLLEGGAGLNYFQNERELSSSIIKRFGLGYKDESKRDLYKHLKRCGFTDEQMDISGLVKFYNGVPFDRFQGRVILPIFNTDGNVAGFSGRILKWTPGCAKYLTTKETMLFDKKHLLFGLNLAKKHMEDGAILCEGNMDVIAMHQAGFDNSVAALGTAFSAEYAKMIGEYTKNICLVFDNDKAGIDATLKAVPILIDAGFDVSVADLSPYKDPDEFLHTEGADAFEQRLDNAKDAMDFIVNVEAERVDQDKLMDVFAKNILNLSGEGQDAYCRAVRDFFEIKDRSAGSRPPASSRVRVGTAWANQVRAEIEREP